MYRNLVNFFLLNLNRIPAIENLKKYMILGLLIISIYSISAMHIASQRKIKAGGDQPFFNFFAGYIYWPKNYIEKLKVLKFKFILKNFKSRNSIEI